MIFLRSFKKRYDLKLNHKETKGKVVNYHFSNNDFILDYIFQVDSVEYKGWIVVSKFKCDTIPFCIGNFFKVYYDPNDPNNNTMYLGGYSDYQENPPNWGNAID